MAKLKIYFLGSGNIAVPVLDELVNSSEIELVGIGTQQDRPAGRKRQLHPTPVGVYAAENSLNIDKPASVNDPELVAGLRELAPDVILVISYGQLLKSDILELPEISCLNIHASLLPKYRGASPIVHAILNHDSRTGNCFMEMEKGLDTGPVYRTVELPLDGIEYADSLELDLGKLAADSVIETLLDIVTGKLTAVEQDNKLATVVGKIHKNDGIIDWRHKASHIEAMVRAFHPWPGATFEIKTSKRSLKLKITVARVHHEISGKAGEVIQADKQGLIIACGSGALEILKVVPQGKKEMRGVEFLNGCHLAAGTMLVNQSSV
ncbi:MAG: methionyl-tRNA formyltransferase [Victivallaceae bacterium]|nr:methionyl-tRNA formyltransferase [Victivallaceae bacterium]